MFLEELNCFWTQISQKILLLGVQLIRHWSMWCRTYDKAFSGINTRRLDLGLNENKLEGPSGYGWLLKFAIFIYN